MVGESFVSALARRHTMPQVLFKLFFRTLSWHIGLVWLVLVLLVTSLDLIRIAAGRAFAESLLLAVLKAPHHATEILPFACIIGATLAIQRMAANNSMVALRTTGLSPLQIVGFTSCTAIIFAAAYLLISETLLAPSEQLARYVKKESRSSENAWLRNGEDFVRIGQIRPDGVLVSLTVYDLHGLKLNRVITAAQAHAIDEEQWRLSGVVQDGQPVASVLYPLPLPAAALDAFKKSSRPMALHDAVKTHRQLAEVGRVNHELGLVIWQHILLPPSLIGLAAASIWFVGRQRRAASLPVLLAALIGGIYYIGLKITVQIGVTQDLYFLLCLPLLLLAATVYQGIRYSQLR